MCDTDPFNDSEFFQFNGSAIQGIEQSHPSAEQERRQINLYFVEQPGFEALLRNTCADHIDILITGSFLRLADGVESAVRDEDVEGLPSCHRRASVQP